MRQHKCDITNVKKRRSFSNKFVGYKKIKQLDGWSIRSSGFVYQALWLSTRVHVWPILHTRRECSPPGRDGRSITLTTLFPTSRAVKGSMSRVWYLASHFGAERTRLRPPFTSSLTCWTWISFRPSLLRSWGLDFSLLYFNIFIINLVRLRSLFKLNYTHQGTNWRQPCSTL